VTAQEHRVSAAERRVADPLHSPFGNDTFGRLAGRLRRPVDPETNTELTERIASLTAELHAALCDSEGKPRPGMINPGT
jgi:hypothetical protein